MSEIVCCLLWPPLVNCCRVCIYCRCRLFVITDEGLKRSDL